MEKNGIFGNTNGKLNLFDNYKTLDHEKLKNEINKCSGMFDKILNSNFKKSNSFFNNGLLITNNINDIFSTKSVGILESKPFNSNSFITSNSNFTMNYFVVNSNGINLANSFNEHTQRINSVAINKKYEFFASASNDGAIKLWQPNVKDSVKTFSTNKNCWTIFTKNDFLYAGIEKGIVIWDLRTLRTFSQLNYIHSEPVLNISVDTFDGVDYMVTSGEDSLINILDLSNQKLTTDSVIATMNTSQISTNVEFIKNSSYYMIKSHTSNEELKIYNLEKNSEIYSFDVKCEELKLDYIIDSVYDYSNGLININVGGFR